MNGSALVLDRGLTAAINGRGATIPPAADGGAAYFFWLGAAALELANAA